MRIRLFEDDVLPNHLPIPFASTLEDAALPSADAVAAAASSLS